MISLPHSAVPRRPAPGGRSGATLTEVLMAILVMSIGVVSVITLFPLAILRAVHATQLTNSKVLENNIEDFFNTNTWMLRGSPVDRNLVQPADSAFLAACVIDPLGEQFMGSYSSQFGNKLGGMLSFTPVRRISPYKQLPTPPSYLTVGNTDWTLNDRSWMDQSVCALPDSWVILRDDLPTNITTSAVTFSQDLGATAGTVRLTLISLDGTKSCSRLGTISGTTFTKSTTEPNIPATFGLADVSRAIIEANESRYTWVITCPAAGQTPAASCAVFFRRGYDPEEEFIYDNSGSSPFTTTPTPTTTVNIAWGASDPTPLLREGNFIFDAQNAFWYRIRSYTVDDSARTAAIEIDQPARAAGGGIVIPHGLVDVFEVELRGQK